MSGVQFVGGPRDGERVTLPEGQFQSGAIHFVKPNSTEFWEGEYLLTQDTRLGQIFMWKEKK